ncbi:LysR family transcriptional regulator, partial [uncultured Megasphaera sp.]
MEIRNLNTFLRVASLQNFTRAARELGYSQSNVSAQIKQLETELAHPLFDRIGKNI